jgi:hypothetical protein
MDKIVPQISAAERDRDVPRLYQMHGALTDLRPLSHYAAMPDDEAQRAAEVVAAVLARLDPKGRLKPNSKSKKPRSCTPRPSPPPLDWTRLEQGDLFADLSRWPRRPYCTHDLEAGLRIRSLRQALESPYIQANPPHLRVWALFDIDRPGAATAWQEALLPPPAWTAVNRLNGHAHSSWGLRVPVLVDGLGARDAPMRYLCAIESLMRSKLEADQGFAGLITKNPSWPGWQLLRGPRIAYDLAELAEALPDIEKHRPRRRPEGVGLGRNVHLFDTLRKWSYRGIRTYWGGGLQGWNGWLSACNSKALEMNADLFGVRLLNGREVWHIARSVAKWTWRNLSAKGFSAWQARAGSKGGTRSGETRRQASEDKRASARLMRAKGMSFRAIADELGASVGIVHKWCA